MTALPPEQTDNARAAVRNPWTLAAALIIIGITILAAAQWPAFPYFFDSYYHLAVIQGFDAAGGVTLHAFWEAAPQGHPHLYPPLFHLLLLPLFQVGMAPLVLAKLWCVAAFPLLLVSAWFVFSRLTTPQTACWIVAALASPYSFFLGAVNYLPATFCLIAALWMVLALHRHRWGAAGILLALTFWLHGGLPWLFGLSLLLFGLIEPTYRKTAWMSLGVGLLGALPWLIHLAQHTQWITLQPPGEDRTFETPIALLLLGMMGLGVVWKSTNRSLRLLAMMALGMLPMVLGYRFRFFATQGLFPWLLLAGLTLAGVANKWIEKRKPWMAWTLLAAVLLAAPTLYGTAKQPVRLNWADTPLVLLSGKPSPIARPSAHPLFFKRFLHELAGIVEAHTEAEELVYCNVPYVGGMLSILTGRATTNPLLREMAVRPESQQIRPAKLIVWIKDPSGKPSRQMQETVLQYQLRPLSQTEVAYLYINPWPTGHRQTPRAVFPEWLGLLLAFGAIGAVVWELKR